MSLRVYEFEPLVLAALLNSLTLQLFNFLRSPRLRLRAGLQLLLQLLLANFIQQRTHRRTRRHAERDQIIAGQQRWTDLRLAIELVRLLNEEVVYVEPPV